MEGVLLFSGFLSGEGILLHPFTRDCPLQHLRISEKIIALSYVPFYRKYDRLCNQLVSTLLVVIQ